MKFNIIKDYKKKLFFIKKEHKQLIYKSLLHRKNVKKIIQSYIKYKLTMWKKWTRISYQKRTCIILGRSRSIYPKLNLKRHTIKKANATCLITGLNMGKW
jgi:ribosomal protein S14